MYLYAQGLLGQPASGGMSVVLRGESVGDAQLLADMFKGVIVRHPEVLEQLFFCGSMAMSIHRLFALS